MTFHGIDAWWWPFVFILVAGWLATDSWRFLGVYFGSRIPADSDAMLLVRAVATALVAAVIGNLLIFPGGALAHTPVALRIAAAAVGFIAYLVLGKRIVIGIVVAEAVFLAGYMLVV